jgi:hypothetical protein
MKLLGNLVGAFRWLRLLRSGRNLDERRHQNWKLEEAAKERTQTDNTEKWLKRACLQHEEGKGAMNNFGECCG